MVIDALCNTICNKHVQWVMSVELKKELDHACLTGFLHSSKLAINGSFKSLAERGA